MNKFDCENHLEFSLLNKLVRLGKLNPVMIQRMATYLLARFGGER